MNLIRIRRNRSFQAAMVPLGAVVVAMLQVSVAGAQGCIPTSVTNCCEIDSNPCYGQTNAACNGLNKSLMYTANFPDGASPQASLNGTGGGGSAGVCNGGVITPQPYMDYWPLFYTPQTGPGYAMLSEADLK
jgi:hypothetical protein